MPRISREPTFFNLAPSVAEVSIGTRLQPGALTRAEASTLEAALTLAPGSQESVLEASHRIEGICRWAYIQMGRKRTSGIRQARRTEVRESAAQALDIRGRVTCP
jgi:hypothetical protein